MNPHIKFAIGSLMFLITEARIMKKSRSTSKNDMLGSKNK